MPTFAFCHECTQETHVLFALLGLMTLKLSIAPLHGQTEASAACSVFALPQCLQFEVHLKLRFWIRPGQTSRWWDDFQSAIIVDAD